MKIFLLGDYSSVHYNLWRILNAKGMECTLLSDGDSYKNIPTQLKWMSANNESKLLRYANSHGQKFWNENLSLIENIKGYDVVQIVNPVICEALNSTLNKKLFDRLLENNKKIFLYSVGDDYKWVSYHLRNDTKSMFNNRNIFFSKEFYHSGRYLLYPGFRNLCNHVENNVNAIIPGSIDYLNPYKKNSNCTNVVPFPIDINLFQPNTTNKGKTIRVFHGIQKGKNLRKGDYIFTQAKKTIKGAEFIDVVSVPFTEYIELMKISDFVFDQIFSYDQGMNAIMGMAYGKVVFSGFEREFLEYYNIDEMDIGINTKADPLYIADKANELISSPKIRSQISSNARDFIMKHHADFIVCNEFMKIWECY